MKKITINKNALDRLENNIDLSSICERIEVKAKELAPVDTGRLMNSIKWSKEMNKYYVTAYVSYGIYLELGTSKMEARPFLVPALYTI